MIVLQQVSKTFGPLQALRPTDLTIPGETTIALIGPSGCGKSTLLRLIVGLIEPTTGSVEFNGQKVDRNSVESIRRKMGYVIQDGGLFPHLTAEQNVLLLSRHLGIPSATSQERIKFLCSLTHFPTDALARYPVELSGGQRQRVSLMRALQLDPDVLLLDEPLGALDSIVRASLQADLKRIFRELKKTVVLVTHDLAEAAYIADTLVLMKEGQIVQQGPFEELKSNPKQPFVTEFIEAQRSLVAL